MDALSPQIVDAMAAYNIRNPGIRAALRVDGKIHALVVALTGDMGTESASDFLEFSKLILPEAKRIGTLVVDLQEVRYIASMGVGALTALLSETYKAGTKLKLSRVPKNVETIMTVLGFMSYFEIEDIAGV